MFDDIVYSHTQKAFLYAESELVNDPAVKKLDKRKKSALGLANIDFQELLMPLAKITRENVSEYSVSYLF